MPEHLNNIPSHSNPPPPPPPKKKIDLGTFRWENNNVTDHELKIAILNFLSAHSNNLIPLSQIIPKDQIKKDIPVFEQLFYYIQNLPKDREASTIPESKI